MSYTTLYRVPESGEIKVFREFRNAFRGGFLVWDQMSKRYLGHGATEHMLGNTMQQVWDLFKDERVKMEHRIVMMSTFDTVMVKQSNLTRLMAAFDQYASDFDDPGHIPDEAEALRELVEHPECFAVCWQQTSVAADTWMVPLQDGSDEWRTYDLELDNDHWFLFDELDKETSGEVDETK